jgi:hypothetical protein
MTDVLVKVAEIRELDEDAYQAMRAAILAIRRCSAATRRARRRAMVEGRITGGHPKSGLRR